MEDKVKLVGSWPSPYGYRVLWALELKGVKYQYVEEDLRNKSELLLNINPVHKKIPVLVHGGKPIAESAVILEYIDETWPHHPLLPKDPYERAMARFWTNLCDGEKGSPFVFFFIATGEEHKKAVKEAKEVLKTLEEEALAGKKYFGGEEMGMADLAYGWIATSFRAIEEVVGVKIMDSHSFPGLNGWIHNFRHHTVIKNHLPDHDQMVAYYRAKREQFLGNQTA